MCRLHPSLDAGGHASPSSELSQYVVALIKLSTTCNYILLPNKVHFEENEWSPMVVGRRIGAMLQEPCDIKTIKV